MSFTYYSNRAQAVFREALAPLGGVEAATDGGPIDLLYHHQAADAPLATLPHARFALMDRALTVPLANALSLARRMQDDGQLFPRHCFDPAGLEAEATSRWVVKDPQRRGDCWQWPTDAAGVEALFRPGYVIQEIPPDPVEYLGCPLSVRTHVLVCNRLVLWFPESILTLHGKNGDRLIPSGDYKRYFRLKEPMVETMQNVFSLFEPELGKTCPAGRYCLFGLDLQPCRDGRVALLDITDRPNLVHEAAIARQVDRVLLQSMCRLLLPDKVSSPAGKAFEELMFYD